MDGRRRILLERAVNVRDLGGYPRRDGGATPYGRFYRADNMHGLTSGDMEELYGLGLRTVLDLRTPGECAAQPNCFEGFRDVQVLHHSLLGESTDQFTGFVRSLGENYAEMIRRQPELYAELFVLIAGRVQEGGVLFHCTAGKDRTGVTAGTWQADLAQPAGRAVLPADLTGQNKTAPAPVHIERMPGRFVVVGGGWEGHFSESARRAGPRMASRK